MKQQLITGTARKYHRVVFKDGKPIKSEGVLYLYPSQLKHYAAKLNCKLMRHLPPELKP